ncbi:type II toxin-antitoxin system PemK/MazF family toxin [Roseimarinus sediminis]|uniref:type II toxin-antitoxin system PemK/MazF family toxin n=1 Tax=Roseimarinus sediminis TaxID=1610899 RepID=UPI003D23A158
MKQNEIWLINLEPTIGSEIRKVRPVIIVNDNSLGKLPLKVIVPITDWKDHYAIAPWMIKLYPDSINFLEKISCADCFQVRSVSQLRFIRKIGELNVSIMDEIRNGLSKVLSIR